MKILSSEQIRAWDLYTIENEPISSIMLMERASAKVASWIQGHFTRSNDFIFLCGNGNNGGDGLAVARMLFEAGYTVHIYMFSQNKLSEDCQVNLQRLKDRYIPISFISTKEDFPLITEQSILIDALFGTGLNKPLTGIHSELIYYINSYSSYTLSIDVPSGLFCDKSSFGNTVIEAKTTLSFQIPKMSFFWSENERYIGNVEILDIGLDVSYYNKTKTNCYSINLDTARSHYKKRQKASHKYSYGNAIIIAGSSSMMGAALLCAKACMRSGAGLVTIPVEEQRASTVNIFIPEALVSFEKSPSILLEKKKAVAFGPGIHINEQNRNVLEYLINQNTIPTVVDATGLHILSDLIKSDAEISFPHLILTPHLGEFEMLFGKDHDDFERMNKCINMAIKLKCIIVLKGHHTLVALPDGDIYYNTTGNSGMATAGSGDVLTGIIAGLLAQEYDAKSASILGVYCHGLAGDIGAKKLSQESLIASDIIENLGPAFIQLKEFNK